MGEKKEKIPREETSQQLLNKSKCTYPKCEKDVMFTVRKGLELCEEHYYLFQFMNRLLFEARIEVILTDSRFKEAEG